ncbi:MAG: ABC transporter ATP-binding protein [Thermoguttaceae bacterium]|nr:ABC transporter ATP-binding protein [Thermoguttaceae bacterium]
MIRFENVVRRFGSKTAVAGLNLEIPAGELFAFLGPNGAGKTTTIKMLVGLLHPSAGRIRVAGYDAVSHPRDATRFIGYVPDQPFLYDKLSGREFLEFVAEMRGLDRAQTASAIARQSEQFELGGFLDDLTETYSHGMKQRTVFASALLHDPPVLVVDEPMVGLDPKSMRLVKDLLREKATAGAAVFMSTHTLSIAEEVADRIGIIDHGQLKFLGTKNQLEEELSTFRTSLEDLFLKITGENGQPAPDRAARAETAGEP